VPHDEDSLPLTREERKGGREEKKRGGNLKQYLYLLGSIL
jgi:hypothetical protein